MQAAPFSLSGVIREYRAGPLANVTVTAKNANGIAITRTQTDANGFYRFDGLTERTFIWASKDGYDGGYGGGFPNTQVVNTITMNRSLQITAGETLSATIWGDSSLYEEDEYTYNFACGWDGNTPTRACRLIHVTTQSPGSLTVRLSFHGAVLGVYISNGSPFGPGVSGPSPLELSGPVLFGNAFVIVTFENPPSPDAMQTFELATKQP
jgi:hypothetical protein